MTWLLLNTPKSELVSPLAKPAFFMLFSFYSSLFYAISTEFVISCAMDESCESCSPG